LLLIGHRLRVVRADEPVARSERIDLVLATGAFGSGEHETTASCLEMLEGLESAISGARVLDLGSGTGILAIAALKLGAKAAVCVDVETAAVETARRICELNRLTDRVRHVHGRLEDMGEDDFDLVLANLHGDVLVAVADELVTRCAAAAPLILSGILWEDSYTVRQRYQDLGCELLRHRMLEEYCTVVLRAPG
jgi:ribosomal protein L11 methyltransferase